MLSDTSEARLAFLLSRGSLLPGDYFMRLLNAYRVCPEQQKTSSIPHGIYSEGVTLHSPGVRRAASYPGIVGRW